MKTYKIPPKINLNTKFHPKRTMGKWSKIGENFRGAKFVGGGDFEIKMRTYKLPSKNESMYEVSS